MGLFNTFVHDPIYNLLVYFYNTLAFQDFGIAIILVTILIKFVFIPLSRKQIESQKQLQEFQPKIKAIQQKYKDDKERQTKELMAFYKENKINPLGGCLPLVVQLVFLFALYRILFGISKGGFTVDPSVLYSFVHNPGTINDFFLGTLNLGIPSIPLAVITAAAQYWQTKTLMQRQAADKEEKKEEKKRRYARLCADDEQTNALPRSGSYARYRINLSLGTHALLACFHAVYARAAILYR